MRHSEDVFRCLIHPYICPHVRVLVHQRLCVGTVKGTVCISALPAALFSRGGWEVGGI